MLNEMLSLKDDYVDHGHDCLIQIMLILGRVVIVGWLVGRNLVKMPFWPAYQMPPNGDLSRNS
jgi:hypothetical protein